MTGRASRRRTRGAVAPWFALAALAALVAPAAWAAPAIAPADGSEGDVWNAARPAPAYTITGTADGALIRWSVPGSGLQGQGVSPLTVELPDIPDGEWALTAGQAAPPDPGRARRDFTIDRTPPAITVRRPADGGVYDQGARVEADYECAGAVACAGTVARGAPIDTASPGGRTLTVAARDAAANEAVVRVAYTVRARASAAGPVPEPPSGPIAVGPPPGTAPRRREPVPATRNARLLRPAAGARVTARRTLLRWAARRGARLYNVQVFRVREEAVTKVHSAFTRRAAHRVPAGRLTAGERYAWRVWPFLARGGYADAPLGVSWFDLRRPVRLTPRQLLVNQRISQAAVRRANALERRLAGGLTGGDLRPGAVAPAKLAPGLRARPEGPPAPQTPPSRTAVAAAATGGGAVRLTDRQVLVNQRISQAAVRRANDLRDLLGDGLTEAQFRPGSIGASRLG